MKSLRLFILVTYVIVLSVLVNATKTESKTIYYQMQTQAAEKMVEALEAIKDRRIALGLPIDLELDPMESGIIGLAWPMFDNPQTITTTLGVLEAKQISANPNFAALMVRYFQDLKMKAGDDIVVNFSGSFPALNIATLSAIEVMGLNPVISSSIGASTYGANNPAFPYIEMERYLFEEGILSHRSSFISLGGDNDQLKEVEDENFKLSILNRFADDYEIINMDSLSKNIEMRYKAYQSRLISIKAFVNVGGNMVSFGTNKQYYPNGLIKRMSVSVRPNSGLIERFLRDDIPVIQLLNIKDLARENQMQTTTDKPFTVGEGKMYYDYKYSTVIIVLGLMGFISLVTMDYINRKKQKTSEVSKNG